jgi:hypothetical protein
MVCCHMVINTETGVCRQHTPNCIVTMETGSHGNPAVSQITHTTALIIKLFTSWNRFPRVRRKCILFGLGRQIETIDPSLTLWSTWYCTNVQKSMIDAARNPVIKCPHFTESIQCSSRVHDWEASVSLYAILAKEPAMHPSPSLCS